MGTTTGIHTRMQTVRQPDRQRTTMIIMRTTLPMPTAPTIGTATTTMTMTMTMTTRMRPAMDTMSTHMAPTPT